MQILWKENKKLLTNKNILKGLLRNAEEFKDILISPNFSTFVFISCFVHSFKNIFIGLKFCVFV